MGAEAEEDWGRGRGERTAVAREGRMVEARRGGTERKRKGGGRRHRRPQQHHLQTKVGKDVLVFPWARHLRVPPILQVKVVQGDATSASSDFPSQSSTPLFPLPTWSIHPSDQPGTSLHFDARVAGEHERSSDSGLPPKRKSDDGWEEVGEEER